MHIPAELLSGAVCPVTATLSIAGVGLSAAALLRHPERTPRPADFALTGATVFTLQMLNYPLPGGLSGHLLGGTLAAALLGLPGGILCMALVLLVQTLLFADGGLGMLGANTLNMALIGTALGGLVLRALARAPRHLAYAFAGLCSVLGATLALCAELALCGKLTLGLGATLLGTHAALATLEGLVTLALLSIIPARQSDAPLTRRAMVALSSILLAALLLTPLASAFPDALEWSLARFSLLPGAPAFTGAPFADYAIAAVPASLAALLCALVGCAVIAMAALPLRALRKH